MSDDGWIALAERRPDVGAWVLMYLARYAGVDRFRAGMHMGRDDWMSAANAADIMKGDGTLLPDAAVSHWMPLPDPPDGAE